MTPIDQFDELTAVNMRVNLRRRNVRMPQHGLQRPQISAARQKMRGKGMPQDMGADLRRVEPRMRGKVLNDLEQANPADMPPARRKEKPRFFRNEVQPHTDCVACTIGNGD